jgi:hypothetical protein
MTIGLQKGNRVCVTAAITQGVGVLPKPGDRGTVDSTWEDGTIVVRLDDGRRARLAQWECELVEDGN